MAYDKQLELEVKNFGLSTSEETDLTVLVNGVKLAEGRVKALSPYESVKLSLPCIHAAKIDNQTLFTIVYSQHGKEIRKETYRTSTDNTLSYTHEWGIRAPFLEGIVFPFL